MDNDIKETCYLCSLPMVIFDRIHHVHAISCSISQEQYMFVYDALLEALKVGKTVIPCSVFKQEFERLCLIDPAKNKSGLQEQYEVFTLFFNSVI
jgi:hypothetical protein